MMLQTYVAPVCKCSTSFFGEKEQLDHDEFMQGHSFGTPLHFLHHSKPPVQGTKTNHLLKETKSLTETPLSNTVTPCYMKTKKKLGFSNRRDHIRKVSIEIPVNEGTTSSSLGSLVHLSSSCNHREKTCEPVSPQEPSQIRDSLQVLETVWHGFSISKTWWPSIISLPTNCRRNKETLPEHSIKCVFCFGFGRAYLRYVRVGSLHRKSQPFDRVFSLCPSLPVPHHEGFTIVGRSKRWAGLI